MSALIQQFGTAAFTDASAYTPAGGAASQTTGTFSSTLAVTGVSTLTGTLIIPSTNTTGIQLYNTSDQTTNYERLEMLFSANTAVLRSVFAGSGQNRIFQIVNPTNPGGSSGNMLAFRSGGTTSGQFRFDGAANSTAGNIGLLINFAAQTASSGTNYGVQVNPIVTQSSTAAATDFLINRTQNSVGSGAQLLIDAQVGGTSKGKLSNTGVLTVAGDLVASTAGKGLQLQSGTGARGGNATMVGGTITVTNTTVTANTLVDLTRKTSGGTIGTAITYTLSAGASFTINSDNPLDTSTFTFHLIELN